VYLVAAHRELQSYHFYQALADLHPDGEAKTMLLKIANEEMKHRKGGIFIQQYRLSADSRR